jgi:osmotically-inducible protein OsmY
MEIGQEALLMSRNSLIGRTSGSHPQKLAQAARTRLQRTPYAIIRRLNCDCRGTILVLRGELPSFYYKKLAQEAVGGIQGVTQVVNEVEVTK